MVLECHPADVENGKSKVVWKLLKLWEIIEMGEIVSYLGGLD